MQLVIVTGMSGAGKSTAVNLLEDIGYYCVDNIPPRIIPALVELSLHGNTKFGRIAIVTDTRGGELFSDITEVLDSISKQVDDLKVLFLDAQDGELIRRYKENRRIHPLLSDSETSIKEAVGKERQKLQDIRQRADYILDTTYMSTTQLKQRVNDLFADGESASLKIHCMSFGFKHGSAAEADLVFDVRCLPNPFYDVVLRPLSGLDKEIKDFVFSSDESRMFTEKLLDFINFAVPMYKKEGKTSLVIAFGCTGGQHRSVAVAELVREKLQDKGYIVSVGHRDRLKNHY